MDKCCNTQHAASGDASKKGAEDEKSIEVVGNTRINNESYCTALTDHIIDGDCAKISIPRPHKSHRRNDHSDSDGGYVRQGQQSRFEEQKSMELPKLCSELAVSASGTKAEMVARILAARTTSSADEVDRAISFRASLEKESVVKLRNLCHELHFPT